MNNGKHRMYYDFLNKRINGLVKESKISYNTMAKNAQIKSKIKEAKYVRDMFMQLFLLDIQDKD